MPRNKFDRIQTIPLLDMAKLPRNYLSRLPLELRINTCANLGQLDLLSLAYVDKACFESAIPMLYQIGTFRMKLGHRYPALTPSLSWTKIRNLDLVVSLREKEWWESGPSPNQLKQLSGLWEYFGANVPVRDLCQVRLKIHRCSGPNIGAIVQALMALSNFGKVIVRRKYYDNCAFAGNRGFNPRGGLRKTLQPGLGPGKYVWDPNHDEWYLEFFPLQNTVVDGFDGSYEHAMLAAWRRSWEKAGKWH